jgi:hypothetical protein
MIHGVRKLENNQCCCLCYLDKKLNNKNPQERTLEVQIYSYINLISTETERLSALKALRLRLTASIGMIQ